MLFRESMQSNFPLEETSISMVINGGFAIAANPLLGSLNFFINEYESVIRMKTGGSAITIDPTRVIQLSSKPRAFLYKGFLSYEECQHLIHLAKGKLRQSLVAAGTGESVTSKERTSTGMFLRKAQDKIVARIESRIAAWTFLPLGKLYNLFDVLSFIYLRNEACINSKLLFCSDNGEPIQILRYENGQKYEPHFDFFQDPGNIAIGGHRIATILMYLSDVEKGGETVFPNSPVKLSEEEKGDLSECAKVGYGVRPKLGDALLFFSMNPNVTPDATSYHGSCPVIEGEKWSATKWIHMLPIDEVWRNPACVDENDHCSAWAKAGECKKNPVYMMGSKNELGFCRLSCKVCSPSS
ncbi:putative prolyl 4-hydroxylase 7 isoform X2 [Cucumis melo var. makuwa]|uniref:procollagen-proline 4-dioxygenase n=1 Tax=Cucumis melo var. makuwa TaxID=1194695 RepID=A0A5A7UCT9_CUCMM|nr:putative prolyl 4-hydroxylase 7 isoform X2 [Cucumis melo var. makuwa]